MYHIFDIFDKKIAYYVSAKCGSRTICAWGAIMRNPALYVDRPELFLPDRKDGYGYIRSILPDFDMRYINDTKLRICVVRDPVERFISAFTNRVLYLRKVNKEITLSEYINTIDDPKNKTLYADINSHVRPLTVFLEKDPSIFTHIFNLRTLRNLKLLLEETSGVPLPDLHLQQNGGLEKPELTSSEMEWIKIRYREDYDIYGKWM
jgi:hypothetical protein